MLACYSVVGCVTRLTVSFKPARTGLCGGWLHETHYFDLDSWSIDHEHPISDIDMMVIGDLGLRDVVKRLSGLGERLGRELNPRVFTPAEWARRVS